MNTPTERLAVCDTGAVHDVLRGMGRERVVLPPAIKAIAPGQRLAGPVWTVAGHIDRSRSRHDCLLGRCTLLAQAIPHAYGEPIDIGGVTVRTGDWLLGDRDGAWSSSRPKSPRTW